MLTFGSRLRKARIKAGMTQAALAKESGVHSITIANVERGVKSPGLDIAVKLSTALAISLDRLATGRDSRHKPTHDSIEKLRGRTAISQALLAQRAGLSAQHLNAIEHGRRGMSLDTAVRLAQALRVPVAALARVL